MDIDIQILVNLLERSGMTQTEISAAVPCSQSAVSDISNGKIGKVRPSYKIVEGLKSLAKRRGLKVSQAMRAQS